MWDAHKAKLQDLILEYMLHYGMDRQDTIVVIRKDLQQLREEYTGKQLSPKKFICEVK